VLLVIVLSWAFIVVLWARELFGRLPTVIKDLQLLFSDGFVSCRQHWNTAVCMLPINEKQATEELKIGSMHGTYINTIWRVFTVVVSITLTSLKRIQSIVYVLWFSTIVGCNAHLPRKST
jgi:hypothetical protein